MINKSQLFFERRNKKQIQNLVFEKRFLSKKIRKKIREKDLRKET